MENPLFHDDNHVLIPYCSSHLWLGEETTTTSAVKSNTSKCSCFNYTTSAQSGCFNFRERERERKRRNRGRCWRDEYLYNNYYLHCLNVLQVSFLSYYMTQCFQHIYLATSTLWGDGEEASLYLTPLSSLEELLHLGTCVIYLQWNPPIRKLL